MSMSSYDSSDFSRMSVRPGFFGFAFKDASFKSSGTTVYRFAPEKKLWNFAVVRCVNGAK